ncbi:MAG: TMEM43 family protein [Spirochaetes bacterium]|nr:TMEM43 family protein [Spirochaetota bacterium]
MADETSVVSSTGFLGRIKNSLGGAVFGLLLFLGSFGLLWYNEGRTVKTASSLGKAAKEVVDLSTPVCAAANEGKLVHFSGPAVADLCAADAVFGLKPDALRVERSVEMYQWEEKSESTTKEKIGGGTETVTTYKYQKAWKTGRLDSSKFKTPEGHENPALPWPAETFTARPVKVGELTLGEVFLSRIGPSQPLPLSQGALASMPAELRRPEARLVENQVVTCDPAAPVLGAVRLSWTYVPNRTPVSVLGGQTGAGVGIHKIGGVDVSRLENGIVPSATMVANAKSENKTLAWILRLVGFLMMWIGLRMILAPLAMLLAFLPFLKNLAEFGIGIVTFLIAVVLSLLTIAIAWFFYRPVLSLCLLAAAAAAVIALIRYRRSKKAARAAA